ncbi:hypothetical protein [Legionella sp. 16cNR16C]|uniref:hypothetical protein n=1 Tax=Legionella sp. 16cNR16C TaxID=2905656 RepID=UPI001E5FE539|nr:hypothetical protein [Legionella sp. 16cNR16C]MCE3044099.1 hypothetical protein [Legionella sp. 16cNR16C]
MHEIAMIFCPSAPNFEIASSKDLSLNKPPTMWGYDDVNRFKRHDVKIIASVLNDHIDRLFKGTTMTTYRKEYTVNALQRSGSVVIFSDKDEETQKAVDEVNKLCKGKKIILVTQRDNDNVPENKQIDSIISLDLKEQSNQLWHRIEDELNQLLPNEEAREHLEGSSTCSLL